MTPNKNFQKVGVPIQMTLARKCTDIYWNYTTFEHFLPIWKLVPRKRLSVDLKTMESHTQYSPKVSPLKKTPSICKFQWKLYICKMVYQTRFWMTIFSCIFFNTVVVLISNNSFWLTYTEHSHKFITTSIGLLNCILLISQFNNSSHSILHASVELLQDLVTHDQRKYIKCLT